MGIGKWNVSVGSVSVGSVSVAECRVWWWRA